MSSDPLKAAGVPGGETIDIDVSSMQQKGMNMDAAAAAQLMAAAGGNAELINALKHDAAGEHCSRLPCYSGGVESMLCPELNCPQCMHTAKLSSMVGTSSGYLESLPKAVRNRIAFLDSLQGQHDTIEENYQKEKAALEAKYRAMYEPLYDERRDIINGTKEAPEQPDIRDDEPGQAEQEAPPAGVPGFWLGALRNDPIADRITEKDAPILEHLTDVRIVFLADEARGAQHKEQTENPPPPGHEGEFADNDDDDLPKGFRLVFTFSENPYFSHRELVKTYYMVDEEDPVLERPEGMQIQWKEGKDPTVKVMKKKPKGNKGRGANKPLQTKVEAIPSFFRFFDPPAVPGPEDELEEEEMQELQTALEEDYEIGEHIKDNIVPRAVKWFTGEALAEESDEDEDEDDDEEDELDEEALTEDDDDAEEEEADDEDEEATAVIAASARGHRKAGGASKAARKPVTEGEQPQECKQQ